jgi:hypothetical protein
MTPPRVPLPSDTHLAGCTHQDNLYLEQPPVNPRYSVGEQGLPQPLAGRPLPLRLGGVLLR